MLIYYEIKRGMVDQIKKNQSIIKGCRIIYPAYFPHPNSPWQRGTNEHHNGLLGRFILAGKALSNLSIDILHIAHNWVNQLPRRILGYKKTEEILKLLC